MRIILLMMLLISIKLIAQQSVICKCINTPNGVNVRVFAVDYHFDRDSIIVDNYRNTEIIPDPINTNEAVVKLEDETFYLILFEDIVTHKRKYIYIETGNKTLSPLIYTADFNSPYSLMVTYDKSAKSYREKRFIMNL